LTHFRSHHIALDAFLHRINAMDSPVCRHCARGVDETIQHFLFDCPAWSGARQLVVRKAGRRAESLEYLLNDERGVRVLMVFVNSTGRFRQTYGDL
ncbi:hypothetical protein CONPUDRAFT_40248, partial [Coniophora puteana RWD-64-598 SS2]